MKSQAWCPAALYTGPIVLLRFHPLVSPHTIIFLNYHMTFIVGYIVVGLPVIRTADIRTTQRSFVAGVNLQHLLSACGTNLLHPLQLYHIQIPPSASTGSSRAVAGKRAVHSHQHHTSHTIASSVPFAHSTTSTIFSADREMRETGVRVVRQLDSPSFAALPA